MKVITNKNLSIEYVLKDIGTCVNGKYYYIPGWWEKNHRNQLIFHHFENLPNELKDELNACKQIEFHSNNKKSKI